MYTCCGFIFPTCALRACVYESIATAALGIPLRVRVRVGLGMLLREGRGTSYDFTLHFLYRGECRGFAIRGAVKGSLPPQNETPQQ